MSYERASEQGVQFGRELYNLAKDGAYYTRQKECGIIAKFLMFSREKQTCGADFGIGDGAAIKTVMSAAVNPVSIFGVEVDETVAKQTDADPLIEQVINGDFSCDVRISRNVFSFVFGNPIYGDGEDGKRLERVHLEKATNYIKQGGVIVWVMPYRTFADVGCVRYLMRNYERLGLFRFLEDEYKKWQQVAFIGRKKAPRTPTPDELQAEMTLFYANEELIPRLPENVEETEYYHSIPVEPSSPEAVKTFTTVEFDAAAAYELLTGYDLTDYRKLVNKRTSVKPFASKEAGRPPIPPKNDIQYLRAVSGEGSGFTGEEGVDLHLQRGVAEVVEDIDYKKQEDGSEVMVSTTHTDITMTLIETDGRITTLK